MRGLIGHPLGHSYSKIIHEQFINKEYKLYDIDENKMIEVLSNKEIDKVNVTIPYKIKVINYLDELTDIAKKLNSVNCIKNKNGILIGHNSDYDGFLWMLKNNCINLNNKVVAILGSGGASKSVYHAAKSHNAKEIYIVSRNSDDNKVSYDDLKKLNIQCLINTTPVGMYPNIDENIVDLNTLKNLEIVIDIVYNPFNTQLIVNAKEKGIKAIGGIEMLVAQAKSAIEFFDEVEIDDCKVNEVVNYIKSLKQNLVLIGMPSSGKTSIGKLISEKYDYKLIDIDELIEDRINMKIKDYFSLFGEDSFRKIESDIIKEIQKVTHHVISCGGGVIKNSENMKFLRKNGLIIMIDRDIDKMVISNERPLSKNINDLKKLYIERYDLYKKYSDITFENNDSIENLLEKIKREIIL
ncbi:MAG: shikimate dehydrogenase [Erysipelotrichaceae bacterium]|nr:shikimate dehydrogenase [Erysipelotrichaceae bacterium]